MSKGLDGSSLRALLPTTHIPSLAGYSLFIVLGRCLRAGISNIMVATQDSLLIHNKPLVGTPLSHVAQPQGLSDISEKKNS